MDRGILKKNGFSLIEISLGLFIGGVLLLIILMAGKGVITNANINKSQVEINTIAQACRLYYQNQGHWPSQVSDLQPFFLNAGMDVRRFILTSKENILELSDSFNGVTIVKPRGLAAIIDYK